MSFLKAQNRVADVLVGMATGYETESYMYNTRKYEEFVEESAAYTDRFYPYASLMVEAAELTDLVIKPWLRGDDKEVVRKQIVAEAGDVLWNLTAILIQQGVGLDEVFQYNEDKIRDRMARGVIKGDGDER